MVTNKSKRAVSIVALTLILAMVLGTIASALTGCGAAEKKDDAVIRLGGMKGATTIGLVNLVDNTPLLNVIFLWLILRYVLILCVLLAYSQFWFHHKLYL